MVLALYLYLDRQQKKIFVNRQKWWVWVKRSARSFTPPEKILDGICVYLNYFIHLAHKIIGYRKKATIAKDAYTQKNIGSIKSKKISEWVDNIGKE